MLELKHRTVPSNDTCGEPFAPICMKVSMSGTYAESDICPMAGTAKTPVANTRITAHCHFLIIPPQTVK